MSFAFEPALKNKHILLIEDDFVTQTAIATLLRLHQCEVLEVSPRFPLIDHDDSRLRQALPIDLIVTDIMLPDGLTGYDVVETLRARYELGGTPVVAVSAATGAEEIPHCRRRGFQGFLAKPIHPATFGKYLATILAGQPVWQSGTDWPIVRRGDLLSP